jgi:hypothetical protein
VDACTVAALDAITAFAVPNPNFSSQRQSVFSGLVVLRVTPANRSLSLLRTGQFYLSQPFSRRRQPTYTFALSMSTQFSGNHEISVNEIVENRMKQDVNCTSIRRLSLPENVQYRAVLQERVMKTVVTPLLRTRQNCRRHPRVLEKANCRRLRISGRISENTPMLVNSPNF